MPTFNDLAKAITDNPEEREKIKNLLLKRDKLQTTYMTIAFRFDTKLTIQDLLNTIQKEIEDIDESLAATHDLLKPELIDTKLYHSGA